jgi:uncharacterized membrane protein YdjX (TVP38/TMEM64 family)
MRRIAIVAAVVVAAAAAAIALLHVDGVAERVVDEARRAADEGVTGVLVFAAVYIAATIAFVPQIALTIPAGFSYGVAEGFAIAWLTSFAAACLAFALGRSVLRERIARRYGRDRRIAELDRAVRARGTLVVMLLRLSPMFPFAAVNYVMAATAIRPRQYVAGTLVGLVPNTLLYVYLGSIATDAVALLHGHGSALWHVLLPLATAIAVTLALARLARRVLHA